MVPTPSRLILILMLALAIGLEARPSPHSPHSSRPQPPAPQAQAPKPSPEVEALATKLADEPDTAARDALLSANNSLVGAPLLQALLIAGRDARNKGAIDRSRLIYEIMADIAVKANVPVQHALALNNIGLISYDQGDYQDALDWYAKSLAIS